MRRTHRALQVRERENESVEVIESDDSIVEKSGSLLVTLQELEQQRASSIAKIEEEHLNKVRELGLSVDV